MDNLSIGESIRLKREGVGLSQSGLADELGVSRSTVVRWEAGETKPRSKHISQLQELLDGLVKASDDTPAEPQNRDIYGLLLAYQEEIRQVKTVHGLKKVVQGFIRKLGIDYYLYLQVFRGDIDKNPQVFVSTDIDPDWQAFYEENYLVLYDPVWQHCWTRVTPIFSDEVYAECKRQNDRRSMDVLHHYWQYGYAHYVAIPIHGPCCMSMFSVTIKKHEMIDELRRITPILATAGKILYDQMHRLLEGRFSSCKRPRLRPVDRDLMVHLLQGNSVKIIAADFGISESAVRQRVERLQDKLNVRNRQELCLKVVAQGLSLQDVIRYSANDELFEAHVLKRVDASSW